MTSSKFDAPNTDASAAKRSSSIRKPRKVRVPHLAGMKDRGEPIVMCTAYDYPTASLAEAAEVDILLVGDSLGNVVLGLDDTLEVTMDMMVHHTRAARRALKRGLLVADMPFLSYQITPDQAVENAGRLVQEGGAEAVKIEGAGRQLEAIRRVIGAGIPVMGHLGLTPQSFHALGGYRVQARERSALELLIQSALELEAAGVFAIVLELTTSVATKALKEHIKVPIIGIGAGPACDGQVLVWHDLLGMGTKTPPKFCRQYANLWQSALDGMKQYRDDVKSGQFPGPENEYT